MFEPVVSEAGSAATELREHFRDVMKAVRVLKQRHLPLASPIPAGMVGVLSSIESLGDHRTAGCHVKDLAARNALDPSTISRAVTALVRLGLVRRTPDPVDGRASVLEMTEQGRAALGDTYRWYDALFAEALAGWSPHDVAAFSAMLHRFSDDVLAYLSEGPAEPLITAEPSAELDPQHPNLEAAR